MYLRAASLNKRAGDITGRRCLRAGDSGGSDYARPTGLSDPYACSWTTQRSSRGVRARPGVAQALELDETVAEATRSLGWACCLFTTWGTAPSAGVQTGDHAEPRYPPRSVVRVYLAPWRLHEGAGQEVTRPGARSGRRCRIRRSRGVGVILRAPVRASALSPSRAIAMNRTRGDLSHLALACAQQDSGPRRSGDSEGWRSPLQGRTTGRWLTACRAGGE